MEKQFERAAWLLRSMPEGLDDMQQRQFVLLRCVYRAYRQGLDTECSAKSLKGFIEDLPILNYRDKLALILCAYVLAYEAYLNGDEGAQGDVQYLEAWNVKLTGERPYNPFLEEE